MVSIAETGFSMATKTTTIYDVADLAGVSPTTVSRYLNGDRVRTSESIRAAIRELGFAPSRAARSLKLGLTHSVGVVVPDVTNPFFAAVVKGAESISRQGAYNIFLCNTEESSEREESVLRDLVGRVDGIILAPATEPGSISPTLRNAGVPIVFLDREVRDSDGFDSVLVDNEGGMRAAAEHLLALGHTRIALISGPLDTTPGRGRHDGFVTTLADAGIDIDPSLVQMGDFRQEGGYQAALRLLALERPPTAIVSANNLMTVGALRALHAMRTRVPDDVSVVGFDDLDLAELLAPPLTVVDRPTDEQGALAMRLLLNRLEAGDVTLARRIVLDTQLLVRGSTGPPSTATGSAARERPRGTRAKESA